MRRILVPLLTGAACCLMLPAAHAQHTIAAGPLVGSATGGNAGLSELAAPLENGFSGNLLDRTSSAVAPTASPAQSSTAVPESQTFALMLAGLAGIGWSVRRRR